MTLKERNLAILDYLRYNPIKTRTPNCYKEVCDKFGVNKDVVRGILRRNLDVKALQESPKECPSTIETKIAKSNDLAYEVTENLSTGRKEISKQITHEIKTVDDLIREFDIDTEKYDVFKWKCSRWNAQQKGGEIVQMYAVNCELRPKIEGEVPIEEIIREVLSESLETKDTDNPFIFSTYKEKEFNDKTLLVYLSDTHVGANVPRDSQYNNEYNENVFSQRIVSVFMKIYDLYKLHGRFKSIIIVNLGDCIDGFNNQTARGGHFLPQNLTNKEQFSVYFNAMKIFFDKLHENNFSESLGFVSVGDSNHAGSLEYIINTTLKIYLETKYGLQTIVFDKFIDHITIGENTFILFHGKDSEAMKHGFPLNLNDKAEIYLNEYIYHNKINSKNIYVVKGDLHQSAHQWGKRFKYVNVLSLFGGSKWIQTNYGNTKAGTEFQIVNDSGTYSVHEEIYFQ